jgi:hypothetical protein
MQKIDGKLINFMITDELLTEVDRIAKRCKLTRSEMLRNLLLVSTDIYKTYEALGVVKFIEVSDRLKKTVNRSVGQQALFSE